MTNRAMTKIEKMKIKAPMSAYDLLGEVIRLTNEEPLRMNIIEWRRSHESPNLGRGNSVLDTVRAGRHVAVPSCGTIGCVAGWCSVLLGMDEEDAVAWDQDSPVAEALKLGIFETKELFQPDMLHDGSLPLGGTREQADLVINHIEEFRREHEAHLRSVVVMAR